MNTHLKQRVEALLNRYTVAALATCGQAGPQISIVPYETRNRTLTLFVPHNSDHLFNLETQPEIALLTPSWKLDGRVIPSDDVTAPHKWQRIVHIQPRRLHIFGDDGQTTVETLDF